MQFHPERLRQLVAEYLPWGERLVEVFPGRTYAVQQEWLRNGELVRQAVPASWFRHRRRIQSEADFLPFGGSIAAQHLLGYGRDRKGWWVPFKVGVYPMLPGNQVQFCAADFDLHPQKNEPSEDFAARRAAGFPKLLSLACGIPAVARNYGASAFIEISASGSGIHVWLFFSEPVPAAKARRLLWRLLCTAGVAKQMMRGFEGKASFDALFPKQDQLPNLSPGNLIFLPYFSFAYRVLTKTVVPRSVFIDADAIVANGNPTGSTIPVLKLSEFLNRLVRHSPAELEAALAALAAGGHSEEPPDTRPAARGRPRQTTTRAGGLHPGLAEMRPHYAVDWRSVDWRRFLRDSGIAFAEVQEGILRLTDGCPACGDLRHQAWVNGATGYLNCFSSNCSACKDTGGMAPSRWCGLYSLTVPGGRA